MCVMLGSGRDNRRLESSKGKGFLKGFFKRRGCWGLPQWLLATSGCLRSFKIQGLQRSAHSKVVR